MGKGKENGIQAPAVRAPSTAAFIILLVTLWALNLADIFQTLYLKESGFLQQEANYFIDYFLKEGRLPFFGAKFFALLLISLILFRGWFDKSGLTFLGRHYDRDKARGSIQFLLSIGVLYYTAIVFFPFLAMFISGMFTE
jgi:hypothetical protein